MSLFDNQLTQYSFDANTASLQAFLNQSITVHGPGQVVFPILNEDTQLTVTLTGNETANSIFKYTILACLYDTTSSPYGPEQVWTINSSRLTEVDTEFNSFAPIIHGIFISRRLIAILDQTHNYVLQVRCGTITFCSTVLFL